jgi:hypothetical protein
LDFYEEHKEMEIYRTEWLIYADERITGSVDAVFINPDGTLTIMDWKRSKEIRKTPFSGNKKGKAPFDHLPDCNYYHYCLQLNLYRNIIQTYYGFKVKDMYLCIFHPENPDGKYIKIEVPAMQREADLLFEQRRRFLAGDLIPETVKSQSPPAAQTRRRLLFSRKTDLTVSSTISNDSAVATKEANSELVCSEDETLTSSLHRVAVIAENNAGLAVDDAVSFVGEVVPDKVSFAEEVAPVSVDVDNEVSFAEEVAPISVDVDNEVSFAEVVSIGNMATDSIVEITVEVDSH